MEDRKRDQPGPAGRFPELGIGRIHMGEDDPHQAAYGAQRKHGAVDPLAHCALQRLTQTRHARHQVNADKQRQRDR